MLGLMQSTLAFATKTEHPRTLRGHVSSLLEPPRTLREQVSSPFEHLHAGSHRKLPRIRCSSFHVSIHIKMSPMIDIASAADFPLCVDREAFCFRSI